MRQRQESLEAHHGQQNGYQQPRLTASALARMQQLQGSEIQPQNQPPATRSLYDVKAMQKEAVLSYVKLKQQPSRSSRGSQPELSNVKNGLNGTRASSTTSIPQPSPNSSGLIKPLGKLKIENSASISASKRHVVEKSATADAHINQLRMEIESRLRINLPEDISGALADGVILCHVANHVRPRAVPSIHVPSPSVVIDSFVIAILEMNILFWVEFRLNMGHFSIISTLNLVYYFDFSSILDQFGLHFV